MFANIWKRNICRMHRIFLYWEWPTESSDDLYGIYVLFQLKCSFFNRYLHPPITHYFTIPIDICYSILSLSAIFSWCTVAWADSCLCLIRRLFLCAQAQATRCPSCRPSMCGSWYNPTRGGHPSSPAPSAGAPSGTTPGPNTTWRRSTSPPGATTADSAASISVQRTRSSVICTRSTRERSDRLSNINY